MGKFIQLVMGPAGVGKSTYCKTIQDHCVNAKRTMHVANLDPAAENYEYDAAFDVRDLICLEDVMEEFGYGPNGGLVYCMEYLLENNEWLKDELDNFTEDEYIILDCPGQVELYSHLPIMHNLAHLLNIWGYKVVSVYLLDSLCVLEPNKFISGCLLSLSCMLQLELPHINIITKCDLIDKQKIENILDSDGSSSVLYRLNQEKQNDPFFEINNYQLQNLNFNDNNMILGTTKKLNKLTQAIGSVVDDYMMVSFVMLDPNEEESIDEILIQTDHAIQYGEDLEPKESNYDDHNDDEEDDDHDHNDNDY